MSINTGDTVRLNSGGPVMTVIMGGFEDEASSLPTVKCMWFTSTGEVNTGYFSIPMLVGIRVATGPNEYIIEE